MHLVEDVQTSPGFVKGTRVVQQSRSVVSRVVHRPHAQLMIPGFVIPMIREDDERMMTAPTATNVEGSRSVKGKATSAQIVGIEMTADLEDLGSKELPLGKLLTVAITNCWEEPWATVWTSGTDWKTLAMLLGSCFGISKLTVENE